ncbi:hypothetical protein V8E55_008775 [Tylopilus felleus]
MCIQKFTCCIVRGTTQRTRWSQRNTQAGNRSASVNDQGAFTALNFVLAVLPVVLPLVLLIVYYKAYKRLIPKLCNLLCSPRRGLHSTELVHDDSESLHCITSHQTRIQLERSPRYPSVDDPLRVEPDSEPMERPSRPTTASAMSMGSAIDSEMTAVPRDRAPTSPRSGSRTSSRRLWDQARRKTVSRSPSISPTVLHDVPVSVTKFAHAMANALSQGMTMRAMRRTFIPRSKGSHFGTAGIVFLKIRSELDACVSSTPVSNGTLKLTGVMEHTPPSFLLDFMYGAAIVKRWKYDFSKVLAENPKRSNPEDDEFEVEPDDPNDSKDHDWVEPSRGKQKGGTTFSSDLSAGLLKAMDEVILLSMLLKGTTPQSMAAEWDRRNKVLRSQEHNREKVPQWLNLDASMIFALSRTLEKLFNERFSNDSESIASSTGNRWLRSENSTNELLRTTPPAASFGDGDGVELRRDGSFHQRLGFSTGLQFNTVLDMWYNDVIENEMSRKLPTERKILAVFER